MRNDIRKHYKTQIKRMKQLKHVVFIFISMFILACGSKEEKIENGLYLILNEYAEVPTDASATVMAYSHDFLEGNAAGQPTFLEIDTSEFVRLDLAHDPEGVEQADKRINLMITLTDEASEQLADFTEKHIKGTVAIVIGGKAVTKHKVRSRIEGGKLQISRCTDNACKFLLLELKEMTP